jgi:hypothetical protein
MRIVLAGELLNEGDIDWRSVPRHDQDSALRHAQGGTLQLVAVGRMRPHEETVYLCLCDWSWGCLHSETVGQDVVDLRYYHQGVSYARPGIQ